MKKRTFFPIIAIALAAIFAGCDKDNYDPPKSTLSGRVVYQNQPVGVRSEGVQLELWQRGYAFFTKIPVHVAYDGTFSASLFDGDYKLTRLKGNGPWADNTDTINVTVKGGTVVDVPVDPYFLVTNAAVTRSGTNLNATFSLQRGNTTRNLEFVALYIGRTLITDAVRNDAAESKAASTIPNITQPITITRAVPANLANKDFVYARVGVKTAGVAELAYSQPIKVALK